VSSGAPAGRSLVVDLSGAQSRDPVLARFTGEFAAALLAVPGAVRALLLNPAMPLPGGLHPVVLSSRLLRWNTATELRRAMVGGPIAYLVVGWSGRETAVLPAAVADGEVPLMVVLHDLDHANLSGDALRRHEQRLELLRTCDLLFCLSESARQEAVEALGIDSRRCVNVGPQDSWDAVATRTLAALSHPDTAGSRRAAPPIGPRRSERRMRLALVGPMPPVASGVADYNGRITAALAERADLDVLVPPGLPRPPHGSLPRVLPAATLGERINPAGYDAILYTFGNSEHHLATYDLAHRFPGVAWLHDIRLGGFYNNYAHQRFADPRPWMREQLRDAYGPRLPELDGVEDLFSPEWQHSRGIFLSRALVRASRAVIVNSAFAEQLCRLDQGPDSTVPPIIRLTHAATPPPFDDLPARDTDPPVIVSAGSVDPIKAPERLIDALAGIAGRTPARLVFLGHAPVAYRGVLEQRAAERGVAERVSFTGAADAATWWHWLARATVAVQLRRLTNGETSGATVDAQSSGTPVITNFVNAALDYPDGTVVIVDDEEPGDLEAAILRLLGDRAEWERYSRTALAHARANTHGDVADVLLARLDDLVSGRLRAT